MVLLLGIALGIGAVFFTTRVQRRLERLHERVAELEHAQERLRDQLESRTVETTARSERLRF